MKVRAIRLGLLLVGNAIGLWIASLVLDADMRISGVAFIVAVVLFTVLTAILQQVVSRLAERYADAVTGASALVATALALLLTAWISDGLSIDGVGTWLLASLIVWAVTAVVGIVLVKAFVPDGGRD